MTTRPEFISAASSEKITLVHINAKKRLYVFNGPVSDIYTKTVSYFVDGLKQDNQDLVKVTTLGAVVLGTFYYDIETSVLHARFFNDDAPTSVEVIATYKFFYSDKTMSMTHDLENISEDVNYEGRIITSPGYKHKIGIDQALTSLIGEGTLHLKNQDGGLDTVFDTLIFENQDVIIYSWNPDLSPSDARVIYRGKVTNKIYDGTDVKIKIKDNLFALLDAPNMTAYKADDNVSESVQGQYKRRVYGRVDGLRCQSTSQIDKGIPLTGTVSIDAKSNVSLKIESIVDNFQVRTNSFGDINIGDSVIVGQVDKVGGYSDIVQSLNIVNTQDIEKLNLGIPVDRDGFLIFDPGGSVALIINLFGNNNPLPGWAFSADRVIDVTVPVASQASLAGAFNTMLNGDSQYTSVVTSDDIELTHTIFGKINGAEYQGSEVGFSVSSIQNGDTEYFVTFSEGWGGSNPIPSVDSKVNRFSFLTGSGTIFLEETLQDDEIIIGTQSFTITEVISDTKMILSDTAEFSFSGVTTSIIPDRGSVLRNRTFLGTGHVCAEVTHTITNVQQFNRLTLDSTDGLFPGDFLEFTDTSERIEIKNIAPGNIVVLQQNMVSKPAVSTDAVRRPIQEVYVGSRRVNADDYSIFNNSTGCGMILQDDVEFNLSTSRNTVLSGSFTTGSRFVSISTTEVSPTDIFLPGDWIKPDSPLYTTFYKVVNVKTNGLDLSVSFKQPNYADVIEVKSPEYIEDDTVISVNILGRTEDGTAAGVWIQNAAQAEKDLLKDVGITAVNDQSFIDGQDDAYQLISMAIPRSFTSKSLPKVKDIVDKLNKSVRGSLTLDNNLLIKFQVLNVYTGESLVEIKDSDVISWRIKSTNGKTYKTALGRYRFTDVDLSTLESGNKFFSFDSEFVERYIGTTKVDELNLYLYKTLDAEIATRRHLYYNRLGVATLTIVTDLRLEDIEIGQVVIADFQRLYKRFGDSTFRKKTMLVIGKTLTGERTTLQLSDLGNTFNTSSFITPNDAAEYSAATEDKKLIHGYITDNQGITDNDEDTAGVHLIS